MQKAVFKTTPISNFFFGYYDKSPLDASSQRLLAQRVKFVNRMPIADDVLEIGYFDWQRSQEFKKITQTKAWNWQQGGMLQWLGPDFRSKIIFNDCLENKFVAVIMDIFTGGKNILPIAVYSVDSKGEYAICIDNERHYWFRGGYSYQGIVNNSKNIPLDENDGIWLLNIKTKELKQIININQLLKINYLPTMRGAVHYLEHLMFNPSGERFCFLHRWQLVDGSIYARLYTSARNGRDIYLLNDSGRMSHFCWRGNEQILAWGALSNPINGLRKNIWLTRCLRKLMPFYRYIAKGNSVDGNTPASAFVSGDSYILFTDKSNRIKRVYPEVLKCDGHPSFCPGDTEWFVTDTYPHKFSGYVSDLILFNLATREKIVLDRIASPKEYFAKPYRCDLHPKWSYDGKFICVDTIANGVRGIEVHENPLRKNEEIN